MNSYGDDFRNIESRLDSLNGKEYISEHTVQFFKHITKAHFKVKSRLHQEEVSWPLTDDAIKNRIRQGTPLISFHALPLKVSLLKALFLEICTIINDHQNSDHHMVQRVIRAEEEHELSLPLMVEKLFHHDHAYFQAAAEMLGADIDLLLFIALHLTKPFCEAVVEKTAVTIEDDAWLKHYCPFCGSGAHMARLDKENGRRMLYCQLCGSEWRYLRIKCPFCCSEDQKKLTFKEEEKGPYRVEFCDQCGRYIKTLDERKGGHECGEFIPAVEDLATMYLDIVAEKKGYSRSWFFPPAADERKARGEIKTLH